MQADWWRTPKSTRSFIPMHTSTPESSIDADASQMSSMDNSPTKSAATPRAVQFASTTPPVTSRRLLGSWVAGTKRGPTSATDFKYRLRNSPSKLKNGLNEPSPEDLATMMHRHQAGLNMSSAPTTMLKFLFPYQDNTGAFFQDNDMVCETTCFGPGPWIDNANFTNVELRGTANPSNFPGFLVALPATGGKIALASSPSPVLSSAYEALHTPDALTLFIS